MRGFLRHDLISPSLAGVRPLGNGLRYRRDKEMDSDIHFCVASCVAFKTVKLVAEKKKQEIKKNCEYYHVFRCCCEWYLISFLSWIWNTMCWFSELVLTMFGVLFYELRCWACRGLLLSQLKDTPPFFSQSLETGTHLHSLLSHSDDTASLSVERECCMVRTHTSERVCCMCVHVISV